MGTCLEPVLTEVPRGQWFCPTCSGLGVGGAAQTAPVENNPLPAGRVVGRQTSISRSRIATSSSRRLRSGGNLITRTGQLERIRTAVNNARLELERRYRRTLGRNTVERKGRVKRKVTKKKSPKKNNRTATKKNLKVKKVSRKKCGRKPNVQS